MSINGQYLIGGTLQRVGDALQLDLPYNASSISVSVNGTFSATLVLEQSADYGDSWYNVATVTTDSLTQKSVAAVTSFRVRCTVYASGQAQVALYASEADAVSTGGGTTSNVNIADVAGSPPALNNTLPVELSDGTNAVGTAGNPLSVNVITGGGSNASVGLTNATAPTSATEIGSIDGTGKLQAASTTNPVPVTDANLTSGTQKSQIVDSTGTHTVVVANANPVLTDYGIETRQIPSATTATGSYTSATALGSIASISCAGSPFISVLLLPTGSVTGGGTVITEGSVDGGTVWFGLYGIQTSINSAAAFGQLQGVAAAVATGGQQYFFAAPNGLTNARLRLTAVLSGAGTMNVYLAATTTGARIDTYIAGAATLAVNANQTGLAGLTWTSTTQAIQASQVSAVANGTTTRTTLTGLGIYKTANVLIRTTTTGAVTGTLQLFIQDSTDGGTTWDDVIASNTIAFGAAVSTQNFFLQGALASTKAPGAASATGTLAAGTIRQGPFGDRFRVQEVISGVSGSPTGVTYIINGIFKP